MDHGFDGLCSGSLPVAGVTYTPSFNFGESFKCPSLTADLPFTQVDNTPSNEVQLDGPSRSRKKGAVKKVPMRAKNFSVHEDELLCSAYLNVSKDPIIGVNQPMGGIGRGCAGQQQWGHATSSRKADGMGQGQEATKPKQLLLIHNLPRGAQKMSMDLSAYEERQEVASREEAEQMASRSERKLKALERNVQIQERLLELRGEEEENKVKMLDVEKMPPWVRDYYI
ncbi:hypothetical protein BAE44_0025451 [Dichanthelium oligosanthes]|uniref:No apical meristem-associated C-terminal domain-containing protein n=1 Tax=Dichanthelium oligosanthes TaxID=888268 RepID=A0A1E5UKX3_9POAL|nr:hypothetical protein BAE44_0025451 [Dichanthelium oligosanthes]